MIDINIKVQNLLKNNNYYHSLKSKIKKNYWHSSKDPDGFLRNRLKDHIKEKDNFITNNKNLITIINSLKYKSLCDIGCGAGYLLSALKKNKHKLLGIDNDNKALKLASQYSKTLKIDLNDKNFKFNKKFDLITCYHVIEHIKSPINFINNIHKMLNNDGHIIIGTPDFDSAMARLYKNKYRLLHDKTHISLFSLDSLCRFLRDYKFEIIQLDFPFFETQYFNKKNFLKIYNENKEDRKGVSPPFYGNFITVVAKKI